MGDGGWHGLGLSRLFVGDAEMTEDEREAISKAFAKVAKDKELTPEQAAVGIDLAIALAEADLGKGGIQALADFTALLRALRGLRPLRNWIIRFAAAFGAYLLWWDSIKPKILAFLGGG